MEQANLQSTIDPSQPWDSYASNVAAMRTNLTIFRCPSSSAPETYTQVVEGRVPSTYLACASGLIKNETGTGQLIGHTNLDGALYTNSRLKHRDLLDGLSNTMLVGESLFLPGVSGPDYHGNTQIIDHWCIGTPGMSDSEVSEALGSTAIRINAWKSSRSFIEDIELGYSSRHSGLIQCVFADGHVKSISESIHAATWSAVGTRANSDLAFFED
jgi:prepilin-type processing-associated H-X9-DG protein